MPESAWFSVYLDLTGPAPVLADGVLLDCVEPLVRAIVHEGVASAFFFIRYRDPGPHIRLRLRAPGTMHERLLDAVREAAGPSDAVTGLREVAYEPELERYGGPGGMPISERMFQLSSELVLRLLPTLRSGGGAPDLRFGHGTLGAALLVACLLQDEAPPTRAEFLTRYERGVVGLRVRAEARDGFRDQYGSLAVAQERLLETLVPMVRAAAEPDRLPEPLSAAAKGFHAVRQAVRQAWARRPLPFRGVASASPSHALGLLTSSYLHMHLNRLGVAPLQEVLLCRIARHAFERVPACM